MTITIENTAADTRIVLSERGQMTFTNENGTWAQSDFLRYDDRMSDADVKSTADVFTQFAWSVVNVNGQDVK